MTISRRAFSGALISAPFVLRAQQTPMRARIKVDTERAIGDIDPKIYGNFVEHLGRCVDGGVFQEGSKLSDQKGYRKDVCEGAKNLNIGVLRGPGGARRCTDSSRLRRRLCDNLS